MGSPFLDKTEKEEGITEKQGSAQDIPEPENQESRHGPEAQSHGTEGKVAGVRGGAIS